VIKGATGPVDLRDELSGSGHICEKVLATLPSWFGIPESVRNYVSVADRMPAVVASVAGEDVGILVIMTHGRYAAEVYVLAVVPELHRRGIGRSMLAHAEDALARAGIEFVQVKTLSPSKPDAGYEATRAFYLSYGFRPLEEFPDLWGPGNPALQMIKMVNRGDTGGNRWSLRW
jgi:ribosomal protein S18 acetylase RimI-like enzyme